MLRLNGRRPKEMGMCHISFKLLGSTLKTGFIHCVFMVLSSRMFIHFVVRLSLQHCLTLNYSRTKRKVLLLCLAVSWSLWSMVRASEAFRLASLFTVHVQWSFRDTQFRGFHPKLEILRGSDAVKLFESACTTHHEILRTMEHHSSQFSDPFFEELKISILKTESTCLPTTIQFVLQSSNTVSEFLTSMMSKSCCSVFDQR